MDIQERINRQRLQHIVDSYQLDGDDGDAFSAYLTRLLEVYPQSLIELALTEGIVEEWSNVPMQKGMPFLHGVYKKLRFWQPDLDPPSQLSTSFKALNPRKLGTTSVDVRAANLRPIAPRSIESSLTPEQFEQITGLDAGLVFDQDGQVLISQPMGRPIPREPQS